MHKANGCSHNNIMNYRCMVSTVYYMYYSVYVQVLAYLILRHSYLSTTLGTPGVAFVMDNIIMVDACMITDKL